MTKSNSTPCFTGKGAQAIFHPYGVGSYLRFVLLNADGVKVDSCKVRNVASAIADTFEEFLRLEGRDGKDTSGYSYTLIDV